MGHAVISNVRSAPDAELVAIADYVCDTVVDSVEAIDTAYYCLLDSLGCAMLAMRYPACTKHLGAIIPGTVVPLGARIPGTSHELDPIKAAFDLGMLIRWLDYNDTWLAAEWGHPSDNLGAILTVADYLSRQRVAAGKTPLHMRDVLLAMIKAHEIQGILALENSFNRVGLDHVILVKVASTAVVTHLLGGTKQQVIDALSQTWLDGHSLRTYRHAPNTGSRKSWAAGDATSRAVRLAMMTLAGEMGYPTVLTAPVWGFYDVLFKGQALKRSQPYASYVMEHVLFKISYPAEFHAQTAVEAALTLYPNIKDRISDITKIELTTHESAVRIINKQGPLHNPADRDHCLQYMVAIALLFGELTADHYEETIAKDPRIDALRAKMMVQENPDYTKDYHDPSKRSIANAVQIFFKDGTATDKIEVEYPVGHRRRRAEGIPLLMQKFEQNIRGHFNPEQTQHILQLCSQRERLMAMPVPDFVEAWLV